MIGLCFYCFGNSSAENKLEPFIHNDQSKEYVHVQLGRSTNQGDLKRRRQPLEINLCEYEGPE